MCDEDADRVASINMVKFLHNLTNKIPQNMPILNSFYATKLEIIQQFSKYKLPVKRTTPKCPRCCIKLSNNPGLTYVKPEQKKSKFANKVLHKVQQNKILTRYQEKYLKRIDRTTRHNTLVTECQYCNKQIHKPLIKPKLQTVVKSINIMTPVANPNKNKKAKKKANRLSGLSVQAVMNAQNNSLKLTAKNKTKTPDSSRAIQKKGLSDMQNKKRKSDAIISVLEILSSGSDFEETTSAAAENNNRIITMEDTAKRKKPKKDNILALYMERNQMRFGGLQELTSSNAQNQLNVRKTKEAPSPKIQPVVNKTIQKKVPNKVKKKNLKKLVNIMKEGPGSKKAGSKLAQFLQTIQ